jgi:hypothetical protein
MRKSLICKEIEKRSLGLGFREVQGDREREREFGEKFAKTRDVTPAPSPREIRRNPAK